VKLVSAAGFVNTFAESSIDPMIETAVVLRSVAKDGMILVGISAANDLEVYDV